MKILLFAKNGQLGWELQRTLAPLGQVIAFDQPEVDFTQPESLGKVVRQVRPDVIINPAAYTAVDRAETDTTTARLVNSEAVGALAAEATALQVPLIHYSTDFVFDGTKGSPYVETDAPHPLNVYGSSKLDGEQAALLSGAICLVLRTSWVYSLRQGGFVTKVLGWAREQETLRIVDDQISGPTSARMLAEATALLLVKAGEKPAAYLAAHAGLYHLAGEGSCSRYEWAKAILSLDPHKEEQMLKELQPAKSSEFSNLAVRPQNSTLNCDHFAQTFDIRLPHWQNALKLMMGKE